MSNFKEAAKQKLRFNCSQGNLSVENLYDLPIGDERQNFNGVTTLDSLAVKLQEQYENSKGKSFLTRKSEKDKTIKLQFDIVLEILEDKVEARAAAKAIVDNKKHNEKILGLIQEKEEEELKEMSKKALTKMLK